MRIKGPIVAGLLAATTAACAVYPYPNTAYNSGYYYRSGYYYPGGYYYPHRYYGYPQTAYIYP